MSDAMAPSRVYSVHLLLRVVMALLLAVCSAVAVRAQTTSATVVGTLDRFLRRKDRRRHGDPEGSGHGNCAQRHHGRQR